MSVRASASAPSSCSGAMYWNVPRTVPAVVSGFISVGSSVEPEAPPSPAPVRASPKSRSFAPGLRQHDVAGLEVAVDDALLVRGGERVGDLRPELHHLVERQRALLQAIRERLALEELHHQEVRVALVPDVEERADVGVVERRDRLGLALEALAALLVLGEAGRAGS